MCRRIKMQRVEQLGVKTKEAHLAVFRLTRPDRTSVNYVWIFGSIEKQKKKLFCLGSSRFIKTHLARKYSAKFPTVCIGLIEQPKY